jgi:F-type H+-transporting ATPase subunit delta
MSEIRIASRYAKSLIELAQEQKSLDKVMNDMKMFEDICHTNRDFVGMLKSPLINKGHKLAILNKIFKGKVDKATLAIFELITRKSREQYLPEIAIAFRHQYNEFNDIVESTITTVVPLSADLKKEFEALLKKITKSTKILMTEKIDPSLIGGFVLKVGDKQIDDSVHSKLNALRLQFASRV